MVLLNFYSPRFRQDRVQDDLRCSAWGSLWSDIWKKKDAENVKAAIRTRLHLVLNRLNLVIIALCVIEKKWKVSATVQVA